MFAKTLDSAFFLGLYHGINCRKLFLLSALALIFSLLPPLSLVPHNLNLHTLHHVRNDEGSNLQRGLFSIWYMK